MAKLFLSDIEIARANKMQNIDKIAEKLDIPDTGLHHFGRHKAKVTFDQMEAIQSRPDGKIILVLAFLRKGSLNILFNRKSVAIVSRNVGGIVALHRRRFNDEIF